MDNKWVSKREAIEEAIADMQVHLDVPSWSLTEKIALCARIMFDHGHDSGLAGQITARGTLPGTYYTQRLGLGLDEISASSLLLVDEQLNVLEGEGMPNPANRFHSWIYRTRPKVQCVVHTHPMHICALGLLERPLRIAQMDSCMVYDDVGFLGSWPGVPVGDSEGEVICAALGDRRAALLSHHGLVVACGSVEESCVIALQCERSARMQLLAESCGEICDVSPELASEAHDWILQKKRSEASFSYFARRALRGLHERDIHPLS